MSMTESMSKWTKYYSKTHQAGYWFNCLTGEKSWFDPLPQKKYFSKTHQSDYWFNILTGEKSWIDPQLSHKNFQIGNNNNDDIIKNIVEKSKDDDSSNSVLGKRKQSENETETHSISTTIQNSGTNRNKNDNNTSTNKIAIIVPFRDLHVEQQRKKHLDEFIPYMIQFLTQQQNKESPLEITYTFTIYIIQQSNDNRKFNRGKLLNIGYQMALNDQCNIFVFHDVDLLPSNELLKYYYTLPQNNPIHIARVWNRYNNNPSYFGGIVAFNASMYEAINGFPNNFWGWGGEDDEMYRRVQAQGYKPQSPDVKEGGRITDLENMSLDSKLGYLRTHKSWKCMNKTEVLEENKYNKGQNGLTDLRYQVLSTESYPSYSKNKNDDDDDGSNNKMNIASTSSNVSKHLGNVLMITVDVELNNHWTDLVCGDDTDQMSETAASLRIRYAIDKQSK